jgi:hypothetical protein
VLARWERDYQPREAVDPHVGVRWKVPVRLCDEHKLGSTASLDEEVYPFTRYGVAKGDMPIVTPSYPAYNSAGNVNPWTLGVMNEELERGRQLGLAAEKLAASGVDAKGSLQALAQTLDLLVEGAHTLFMNRLQNVTRTRTHLPVSQKLFRVLHKDPYHLPPFSNTKKLPQGRTSFGAPTTTTFWRCACAAPARP